MASKRTNNPAIAEAAAANANHPAITITSADDDHSVEVLNSSKDLQGRKYSSDLIFETSTLADKEKESTSSLHNSVTNTRKTAIDSLELPPPPAYDLSIGGLSIGVPPPERYLPLPVPIPYPAFLSKDRNLEYLEQTIIHDVDARCGSGEVLAMYVFQFCPKGLHSDCLGCSIGGSGSVSYLSRLGSTVFLSRYRANRRSLVPSSEGWQTCR